MQIITKRATFMWQIPYITNGLVAYWDGEWNAGGGIHSPDGTRLYELLSDTSEDVASTFACGRNYWEIDASSSADRSTAFTSALQLAVNRGFSHAEFIATINAPATHIYGNYIGVLGGSFGYNPLTGQGGLSLFSSGWVKATDATLIGQAAVPLAFDIDATARTVTYQVGNSIGNGEITIPSTISNRFHFTGVGSRLYCARIYSRPLTEAERAANLAMDRLRFTEN